MTRSCMIYEVQEPADSNVNIRAVIHTPFPTPALVFDDHVEHFLGKLTRLVKRVLIQIKGRAFWAPALLRHRVFKGDASKPFSPDRG
jgi:hypothetical protein